MSESIRKGILLRFPPGMLERVDAAKGVRKRTEFLIGVIEEALIGFEPPELAPGEIQDENGEGLGLIATAREDGVLEIAAVEEVSV